MLELYLGENATVEVFSRAFPSPYVSWQIPTVRLMHNVHPQRDLTNIKTVSVFFPNGTPAGTAQILETVGSGDTFFLSNTENTTTNGNSRRYDVPIVNGDTTTHTFFVYPLHHSYYRFELVLTSLNVIGK